jgi:hypothetical protein
MKKLFILILLSTSTLMATAQSKDEMQLTSQVEALRKAMVDADEGVLNNLVSADLSYSHSSGLLDTKTSFISALVNKKSDFSSITITGQTIQIFGETAIVRHKLAGVTVDTGTPANVSLNVLLVWQKVKGGWTLIARHAARA